MIAGDTRGDKPVNKFFYNLMQYELINVLYLHV